MALGADLDGPERRLLRKERLRQEALAKQAPSPKPQPPSAPPPSKAAPIKHSSSSKKQAAPVSKVPRPTTPLPPVPLRVQVGSLSFEQSQEILPNLAAVFLREKAALWWVSNQSDDLLCLPGCRITHLEYQLRTALKVLGPLRGRALLSDEVGLGKTIEAGLVISELLTRGMAKKVLVLTLPSLVDLWAEELSDKFGIETVTTNSGASREDVTAFWTQNPCIVASLHTVKQAAQLAIAREQHWDILIVDEAHYLRNRSSLAWQAVNALPRQYLLLLTATPVQNSLEELYNLALRDIGRSRHRSPPVFIFLSSLSCAARFRPSISIGHSIGWPSPCPAVPSMRRLPVTLRSRIWIPNPRNP